MIFEKLKKQFSGLKQNELLFRHCTFRVGGPADLFFELKDIDELPALLETCEEHTIPYRIIGRGTNILFTDRGFRGLIIKNVASNIVIQDKKLSATSGTLLAQIIQKSVEQNLSGLEPLYGLPGSIGGAVWGNAGVPQCEIANFVESGDFFSQQKGRYSLQAKEITFKYRWSSLQNNADPILRVTLMLHQGNTATSKDKMTQVNAIRLHKQPQGFTCGSFFKNPSPETPAGKLIDQAGLKGTRIGGAEISQKHGNFFMNTGKATATDILSLAALAENTVFEKFGIRLEREVKIIGEAEAPQHFNLT